MPADANKALVRRFFETINDGQIDTLADELLAPDYRLHFDSMPDLDRAGAAGFFGGFLTSFPGIHHVVEDQVAEDDRVASRIIAQGTHQGDFMGLPPSGKHVSIKAINIHRIADGKIAEQWVVSDGVGLMQQLGMIPAPGQ